MRSIIFRFAVVIVLLAPSLSFAHVAFYIENELMEEIISTAHKFEKAIEVRNFKVAKEQLELLFPMMKKEIKSVKKDLHLMEKEGDQQSAEALGQSMARKLEIESALQGIVEGSSAALRVQSDRALQLVQEYLNMVDHTQLLLTPNN